MTKGAKTSETFYFDVHVVPDCLHVFFWAEPGIFEAEPGFFATELGICALDFARADPEHHKGTVCLNSV